MNPTLIPDTDPFAVIEQAARQSRAEDEAAKQVSNARFALVMRKEAKAAFFATLALRLTPIPIWHPQIPTAATDGKRLLYNPDWWSSLTAEEQIGVMCHEVMHNALAHHARRGLRDPQKWNVAADLAINSILLEAGYALPSCGVFAGKGDFAHLAPGLSAEEYYPHIPDPPPGQQGNDPGGCGGVMDAGDGTPAELAAAEAEAKIAVAQAAQIARSRKDRGDLPAALARLIDAILEPVVDWKAVLREFVTKFAQTDYSWFPPDRRHIADGIYLPSLHSESLGNVGLLIDLSGSTLPYRQRFAGEMQGILDCLPSVLFVVYHDCEVHKVVRWEPSDGPLNFEDVCCGGTSHIPAFDRVEADEPDLACVVCLTDGWTCFPDTPPPWPVLWVSTERDDYPFGQVVRIRE